MQIVPGENTAAPGKFFKLGVLHATRFTKGSLTSALDGIRWAHEIAGFRSPTESNFVKKVWEGAKRLCPTKSNKKDPLEPEFIEDLFSASNLENLSDIRFLLILTLSFAGFFRISELLNLRMGTFCSAKIR